METFAFHLNTSTFVVAKDDKLEKNTIQKQNWNTIKDVRVR